MKLVKAIYSAPINTLKYHEDTGITIVTIKYENTYYSGIAWLSELDKDFYSKKVGYNIALSKARIKALQYYYEQEKKKYEQRYQFFQEVLGHGAKKLAEIDPTSAFSRNLMQLQYRVAAIKEALEKEKTLLRKYVEGQNKAVESVKRFRQKVDNN